MEKPMVSIIVPVYNAEKYLRRCVESILNQEYRDFELLLMNDGSKDSSGEICREYAEADDRIRFVDKENSGVSDTRNQALDLARGKYIQFLDSDDWMTPDSTKLLVRAAEDTKSDMIISDFYRVVGKRVSQKGDIDDEVVMNRQEFAEHMMENPADFYYGVLWNKLYKREIIETIHLRMDPKISWCEDFLFNLEYIRHAKTFYALQVPVYYYVKTEGSLVSQSANLNKTIKMKLYVFEYYNEFYKDIYDDEDYEDIQLQLYGFFFKAAKDAVVLPTILPGSYKLGKERTYVSEVAVFSSGLIMEEYQTRKLIEHYCEAIALKNDMTLGEIMMIFYLSQPLSIKESDELAEYMGIPKLAAVTTLQKLMRKGFVKKKLKDSIELTEAADKISEELSDVQEDYHTTCFKGFTEEEKNMYQKMDAQIKTNVQQALTMKVENYEVEE